VTAATVTPTRVTATPPTLPAPPVPVGWLRRPLVACLVLLVVYVGLSFANNPHAFLGTDTGGKVATLRAMDTRGDLNPDLGYWAQALDRDGVLHPITLTRHLGGQWVNVTTLPMIYAAYPLYELGGVRAILVLPMLGGILTALGARALARRLGGRGDLAFWLVGLTTPVVVYALDFWEHTLGLAAMVWGVVWLLDVADRRTGWRGALAGGALFGLAATMRTEALVYAVATIGVVAWSARRQPRRELLRRGMAVAAGLAVPLVANQLLEKLVLGAALRASRASGAASDAGVGLVARLEDGLRTTVGLNDYRGAEDWLFGALIVAALGLAILRLLDDEPRRRQLGCWALGVAGLLYALRLKDGLGFLPGLLVASPLAVAGVVVAGHRRAFARPVTIAVVALPLVFVAQYGGGANPQWGGRYVLLSGLLLAVVAAVALESAAWRSTAAVVVSAATVTGAGLAWLTVRSHAVARAVSVAAAAPGPIVTTDLPHFWREGGGFYTPDRPWLTAETTAQLPAAVDVVRRLDAPAFTLVSRIPSEAPRWLGPYTRGTRRALRVVSGIDVSVSRYHR
jgi:hypothetical protein